MGINVAWRKVLSEAREKLRHECLRGRIWGQGSEPMSSVSYMRIADCYMSRGEETDMASPARLTTTRLLMKKLERRGKLPGTTVRERRARGA
jgi:hypothetical protein